MIMKENVGRWRRGEGEVVQEVEVPPQKNVF